MQAVPYTPVSSSTGACAAYFLMVAMPRLAASFVAKVSSETAIVSRLGAVNLKRNRPPHSLMSLNFAGMQPCSSVQPGPRMQMTQEVAIRFGQAARFALEWVRRPGPDFFMWNLGDASSGLAASKPQEATRLLPPTRTCRVPGVRALTHGREHCARHIA